MGVYIWKADERVSDLAADIIAEHHPKLTTARILFLFRDPGAKRGGQVVLGKAKKASPELCALYGQQVDFVITLSGEHWTTLSAAQKNALLDHELSHCDAEMEQVLVDLPDGTKKVEERVKKWRLVGHDIEEFNHILKRHGAWDSSIQATVETLKQLGLFTGRVELVPPPSMRRASGE